MARVATGVKKKRIGVASLPQREGGEMTDKLFDIPIESFTIKRHTWLWFKFYWYKWIRRKNIIGFFDRVPIIVTKELDG